MKMIDAHAHMHSEKYDDDREEVIARAFQGGLEAIVNIGTSVAESEAAIALAEEYDQMYATIGLHPHAFNGGVERENEWEVNLGADVPVVVRRERLEDVLYDLEDMAHESEKVVAVGEIGLDYFSHGDEKITDVQKQWQEEAFRAQIDLAQRLALPVVVHCRPEVVVESDAYHDCVDIIKSYPQVQFVMHCYMGNVAVTERLLVCENVQFSFTGNVTYSKNDTDEMSSVLKLVPLERMMIETDAPYLTPQPHRGTRNEPSYVRYVAERIAFVKNVSVEKVCEQTMQNAEEFFGL